MADAFRSRVSAIASNCGDRLAVLALVAVPLAVLGRGLVPGKVISPADLVLTRYPWAAFAPGFKPSNPLFTDVTFLFHPWLLYAASEVRQGRLPLWNPHAFAGAPFFANPQSGLLFPLNMFAYVAPATAAVALISIAKLATAGVATYWFLRIISVDRLAAFMGGAAFMFSSAMVLWMSWSLGSALAVMPLLFVATERLRARGTGGAIAALAGCVALEVFAGYPQALIQTGITVAAWAVWRAREAGGRRFLARFALAWALGALLASVQLLPFLEYARESAVLFQRADGIGFRALPLASAVTFLMPYYYGTLTDGDYWGYMNFSESTMWVGVVPLLVVPLALRIAWWRAETRFWLGAGAASAAVVFGIPPAIGAVAAVPPFSMTLMHRFSAVLVFALCVLCALGLDAIRSAPPSILASGRRVVRAAFFAITGLATLLLAYDFPVLEHQNVVPISTQYAGALALLLAAALAVLAMLHGRRAELARLALVGVQLVSVVPFVLAATPVIEARYFYPPPPPALRHVQARSADHQRRVILGSTVNLGMLYGLLDVAGYDGMTPRRIADLASPDQPVQQHGSGALTVTAGFTSQALNVLAVERVLMAPGAPPPAPHFVQEYDGPDARVYRNDRALPRAFVVTRARPCVPDDGVQAALRDGRVDLRQEVLLAACDGPRPGSHGGAGVAVIKASEPNRVVVHARADAPGYLVLSDTWFPGWRAWVDGVEQPVWRANLALRAVPLPAGDHDVVFRYEPRSIRYGALLSGGTACALVAMALVGRRRRS